MMKDISSKINLNTIFNNKKFVELYNNHIKEFNDQIAMFCNNMEVSIDTMIKPVESILIEHSIKKKYYKRSVN